MCSLKGIVMLVLLVWSTLPLIYADIVFWNDLYGTGESTNYTGENLEEKCLSVPEDFEVHSITTDTCILFYPTNNCLGKSVYKIYRDTTRYFRSVQSWKPCSLEQLGLNVNIYNSSNLDQEPIAKFTNLCKCVNIPKDLQNDDIYVYTEGHEILSYENENCTGSYYSTNGGKIKKSFEPFDRSYNCPLLNAVLTEMTSFTRTRDQIVSLKRLEVIPEEIRSSTEQNVSVSFKGEDIKLLTLSELPWTRRLEFCEVKRGISFKEILWESIWDNETEFRSEYVESHCRKNNLKEEFHELLYFELKKEFTSTQIISVAAGGSTLVQAQRGYVTKYFEYKLFLNITGIWENGLNNVTADDLKKLLPQSGLKFVRKLDAFTVIAEAVASVVTYHPVSTLFQTAFQGSLFPELESIE